MSGRSLRAVSCAAVVTALAGCGGGGGGSPASGATAGTGAIDVPEGVCGSDLYQEIIGTYRGRVSYDQVLEDGSLMPLCIWDMTARVVVDADVLGCELSLAAESTVEQPIVPDPTDGIPFECTAENDVRDLYDPNGRVQPEDLPFIEFPLDFGYQTKPFPANGPYFENPDVDARYIRLFDSAAAVVDRVRFTGDRAMSLLKDDSATAVRLSGQLTKETE